MPGVLTLEEWNASVKKNMPLGCRLNGVWPGEELSQRYRVNVRGGFVFTVVADPPKLESVGYEIRGFVSSTGMYVR